MRMREAARCLAALVLACGVTVAVAGEFMLATPRGSLPRAVTNEWNAAGSWTGGAVPTAGDVVRSGGMLTTDRLWVMEGTATLGSLEWECPFLRIVPKPGAKASLVLDNAGKAAEWNLQRNGGLMVNVPITYKGDWVLRLSGAEFNEPIAGDGKLIVEWDLGDRERAADVLMRGRGGNRFGGGLDLRVRGRARQGGAVMVVGNGALGSADVTLSAAATLVLESQPQDSLIGDSASVYLTAGSAGNSRIRVHRGGREVIRRLFINGEQQYAGTYGASDTDAEFAFDEHFRFRGQMAGGGVLVVTEGPAAPGTLRDLGVAALETNRAMIGAELAAAAEATEVILFWGSQDGMRDAGAWQNKVELGRRETGVKVSATVAGQSLDRIRYRWLIRNSKGVRWSNSGGEVRLAGAPEMEVMPAVLHRGSATFRCRVVENGAATSACLAWGAKRGGEQPESWEHCADIAAVPTGLVATNIPLTAAAEVHFRWFAKNAHGAAVSDPTSFRTAGESRPGDITFFVTSDTHFVEFEEELGSQYRGIELMNNLAGQPYPQEYGGGVVDVPRGVLVQGDLINDGAVSNRSPGQWALWVNAFGLTGERRLAYPVYECFGNHDLSPDRFVQKAIIERNKRRVGPLSVSSNGLHYSWDWDHLHLVQLNLFPGESQGSERYGPIHNAEQSLDFLKEDLAKNVGKSGRPVLLMHHYDVHDDWWTEAQRDAYYDAIKDYNIVGVVYGHTGTGIGKWHGIDFINDGNLGGRVFVFHVTLDRMTVLCRDIPSNSWKSPMLDKPMRAGDWMPK